ncbi:MAG: hypothetical protein U5L11_07285 [Arhodomonas sp.]|nr:hypothetical protein [Arhodomonas sp.]
MSSNEGRRLRRTEAQWRKIVAAQQASGLSQAAFCRQQGLAVTRSVPAAAAAAALMFFPESRVRVWLYAGQPICATALTGLEALARQCPVKREEGLH